MSGPEFMVIRDTMVIKCKHCQYSRNNAKCADAPCRGSSDNKCLYAKKRLDRIYDPVNQVMWINQDRKMSYTMFSPMRNENIKYIDWGLSDGDFEL